MARSHGFASKKPEKGGFQKSPPGRFEREYFRRVPYNSP
jgi:hypothetical protein